MLIKWLFGGFLFLQLHYYSPKTQDVILEINNIKEVKGYIWVGVYNNAQYFLNQEKAILVKGEAVKKAGVLYVELKGLPIGAIAVAVFHDLNGNGELDQTLVGIPKEPYAFSQKLKSKWRPPQFEDVKIEVKQAGQVIKMNLEEW
jgi:uncharacterized protein (DUF2141 family)